MSWASVFAFLAWVWGVAAVAVLGRAEFGEGARGAVEGLRLAATGWWPVGPWLVPNALRSAGAVGLAVALLAVSDAWGRRLLGFCGIRKPSRALAMTAAFGGYAVLSLAVFGFASTGLCTRGVVVVLGAAAALASRRRIPALAAWGWGGVRETARTSPVLLAGLAVLVVANLPRLVVPEHNEDCLMYHLALPQQLLLRHHLPERPAYWAWGLPLLGDFPNVFAVAFGVDAAVRLTGLGLAWLGVMACMRSLAPGLSGGWTALLGLVPLLVPAENWVLLTAKDDLAVCGAWLAAAAGTMEAGVWRRGGWRGGAGAWAAWLGGCVVAAKLSLAPAVAAAGALALARTGRGPGTTAAWAAVAALPLAPWLLRAWFQYGDPVHPFGAAALPAWFGVNGNGAAIRVELGGIVHEGFGRLASLREAGALLLRDGYPVIAALPVLVAGAGPAGWWGVAAASAGSMALVVATPGGHAQLPRFILPACALMNAVAVAVAARAVLNHRSAAARARAAEPQARLGGRKRGPAPPPVPAGPPPRWPAPAAAVALTILVGSLACRLGPFTTWNEEDPGLRGRAYLAGRVDAEAYRRSLMGSWGLVQPVVAGRCAGEPRASVLVVGAKFLWGIPARVLTNEIGLRPAWDAVAAAATPERVVVRYRQMGVRWIVYDADFASWDRTVPPSYPWTDRQLRLYTEFAKRHFRPVTSTACRTAGYGMHWIFEVTSRPQLPAARVPVLPGADPAWTAAALAMGRSDTAFAEAELRRLCLLLPEVTQAKAALGQLYTDLRRYREAYPLVRAATEEGFLNCANPMLLDWATAAIMTGKTEEGDRLYERARAVYDRWDGVMHPVIHPVR
ncbi:MAG: hypothetical protein AAB152_07450 [Candidatus Coatesbacteria bacterium]